MCFRPSWTITSLRKLIREVWEEQGGSCKDESVCQVSVTLGMDLVHDRSMEDQMEGMGRAVLTEPSASEPFSYQD